jgi:hypothetical protein
MPHQTKYVQIKNTYIDEIDRAEYVRSRVSCGQCRKKIIIPKERERSLRHTKYLTKRKKKKKKVDITPNQPNTNQLRGPKYTPSYSHAPSSRNSFTSFILCLSLFCLFLLFPSPNPLIFYSSALSLSDYILYVFIYLFIPIVQRESFFMSLAFFVISFSCLS